MHVVFSVLWLPLLLLLLLFGPRPSVALLVDVFQAGTEGYTCFRIPSLVQVPSTGSTTELFAIAEGRKLSCSDHGWVDLVMKRSHDGGATWGPLELIYSESSAAAAAAAAAVGSNYVTIGNPCPVYNPKTDCVLLLACRNNRDVLLLQYCNGKWSGNATDLSDMVVDPSWTWVATGPPNSIVLQSGRILVPADHIPAGGHTASHSFYSDDQGETWHLSSNSVEQGNECEAAQLQNGTVLLNMRGFDKMRAISSSHDGGESWSQSPLLIPSLPASQCEGSMIADWSGKRLFFSNPANVEDRINMTLHTSTDGGASWSVVAVVWPHASAYSALAQLHDSLLGLLFEKGSSSPYESISFDSIPV